MCMVHQQPVVQMDSGTSAAFKLVKIIALGQGKGCNFLLQSKDRTGSEML